MSNWKLCEGSWINFDNLMEVFLEKYDLSSGPIYRILAVNTNKKRIQLIKGSFSTKEEAQDELNKLMSSRVKYMGWVPGDESDDELD